MLMYVPIVYGFLPEINVFVFVECHAHFGYHTTSQVAALILTI